MSLTELSIQELQAGYQKRDFTVSEVVAEYLKQIDSHDKELGAYLSVWRDEALAAARELDKKIIGGLEPTGLVGVPMAVKDVLTTEQGVTTAGSKMLAHYRAPYNATAVDKLIQAGVIVLGKTNCDEFAMGSSGENSAFFPTKNPWNKTKVPGGSSSGSAVAVAARLCRAALGTDTGGSIRQPASFSGVVGLKPTYGRVSRYGLIAMTSSLDQVGPLSATVAEAATVLKAIAGLDFKDATSRNKTVPDYNDKLNHSLKGLTVGLPQEFFGKGLSRGSKQVLEKATQTLGELGLKIKHVNLPKSVYGLAAYYIIAPSEISANMARFDGLRFGESTEDRKLFNHYLNTRGRWLGKEVKRRIILGTYVLSAGYYDAYYRQAVKVRQLINQEFSNIFKEVDILACPTTPTVAFSLGEKTADPMAMYLADVNTVPVNIAGLPAISVPAGLYDGLPVGLQLIGAPWEEVKILQVAHQFERARGPWHLPA